jgi:hypothetical protein
VVTVAVVLSLNTNQLDSAIWLTRCDVACVVCTRSLLFNVHDYIL